MFSRFRVIFPCPESTQQTYLTVHTKKAKKMKKVEEVKEEGPVASAQTKHTIPGLVETSITMASPFVPYS